MILVFGATGFSGRMVVEQLAARGIPVRAAARSPQKLEQLADDFPGVQTVVADIADPRTVAASARGCDALITTVGPYTRFGAVAADAAISERVPYIDITGEPAWLRRIFFEYDARAKAAGIPLLPAFGYDYVPGNLGGAVALEHAGQAAVRVDIAYFLAGEQKRDTESFSRGTLDSLEASANERGFAFQGGRIVDVEGPRAVQEFTLDGQPVTAVAIGGTEHFALPRLAPWLRDVNVGLGWFQPGGRRIERDREHEAAGPGAAKRAESRARVIAIARDADGIALATVEVEGPNPYDLSGLLTAWAAQRILAGQLDGTGALGPVEAFGLQALRDGCAEVGLTATVVA